MVTCRRERIVAEVLAYLLRKEAWGRGQGYLDASQTLGDVFLGLLGRAVSQPLERRDQLRHQIGRRLAARLVEQVVEQVGHFVRDRAVARARWLYHYSGLHSRCWSLRVQWPSHSLEGFSSVIARAATMQHQRLRCSGLKLMGDFWMLFTRSKYAIAGQTFAVGPTNGGKPVRLTTSTSCGSSFCSTTNHMSIFAMRTVVVAPVATVCRLWLVKHQP